MRHLVAVKFMPVFVAWLGQNLANDYSYCEYNERMLLIIQTKMAFTGPISQG